MNKNTFAVARETVHGTTHDVYYEKKGRYYRLGSYWWGKGGVFQPSGVTRISKKEFDRMYELRVK